MGLASFVSDYSIIIAVLLVLGFATWKLILEPRINEGQPVPSEVSTDSST